MRPPYDDFDEFAFEDSAAVSRILREQRKEERRYASRKHHGSPEDEEYFDELEDYEDFEDYSDYDEDEFDEYSASDADH
jgi:hypothetical protein